MARVKLGIFAYSAFLISRSLCAMYSTVVRKARPGAPQDVLTRERGESENRRRRNKFQHTIRRRGIIPRRTPLSQLSRLSSSATTEKLNCVLHFHFIRIFLFVKHFCEFSSVDFCATNLFSPESRVWATLHGICVLPGSKIPQRPRIFSHCTQKTAIITPSEKSNIVCILQRK